MSGWCLSTLSEVISFTESQTPAQTTEERTAFTTEKSRGKAGFAVASYAGSRTVPKTSSFHVTCFSVSLFLSFLFFFLLSSSSLSFLFPLFFLSLFIFIFYLRLAPFTVIAWLLVVFRALVFCSAGGERLAGESISSPTTKPALDFSYCPDVQGDGTILLG